MFSIRSRRGLFTLGVMLGLVVAGLGVGLSSQAGSAVGRTTLRAGGIVNTDGSIIAGKGFTVRHPSTGIYTVTYPAGTFPGAKHPVITVTPGTASGVIALPSISAVSSSGGGLSATIVLSASTGSLTVADEDFGFMILEV
jgi:hypothetical protein